MRLVPIDGAKVRELRTGRAMTQEKLADASGISARYISKIENGHVTEVERETRNALETALVPQGAHAPPLGQTTRRRRARGRIVTVPAG